jgi:hypothetical protein
MSSWYDTRSLYEDCTSGDGVKDMRDEVRKACDKFGIKVDLSSEDYWYWKQISHQG